MIYLHPATINGLTYLAPTNPPAQSQQPAPVVPNPPVFVGGVSLSSITPFGAHAAWQAATGNVSGYSISCDMGTPYWIDVGNALSYDIVGKLPERSYTVRLQAYGPDGVSSIVTAALDTPAIPIAPAVSNPIDSYGMPVWSADDPLIVPGLKPITEEQAESGDYPKDRYALYGLRIAIESPRGTVRHWKAADGTRGSHVMSFAYGYIEGTLGNDGDELDCTIGPAPLNAELAYVVNQFIDGVFDEHKIMFGFANQSEAEAGYLSGYEEGWQGMRDCVPCTLKQLKWWIANGNKALPIEQNQFPAEGKNEMEKVLWDSTNMPLHANLEQVLYALRKHDSADGLLFDSLTVQDIIADADGVLTFDALVLPFARLQQRMTLLQKVLDRASGTVKVAAMQVSEPFTQRGSTNVAVVYELTDGQTVSIFFHNPDVTPKKIAQGDELVSWKWMLNKKDITVAVAPERGRDLDVRTVAARIMKLAEKNSERFAKANTTRAAKLQVIADLKTELETKEATLADLTRQIEVARVERENDPPPARTLLTEDEQADLQRRHDELRARIEQLSEADQRKVAGFLDVRNADRKWGADLVDAIDQNHPDDIEAALKRLEDARAAVPQLNVDGIKAVVTSTNPMPGVAVGANWVILNAPRPLLGTETMSNGEFLSGRYYAAIDPADDMAEAYLSEDLKLDASVVFVADEATQMAMALNTISPRYLPAYMEMDEDERGSAISGFITKLNGRTYGELKELAAKGMPTVPAADPEPEPQADPDAEARAQEEAAKAAEAAAQAEREAEEARQAEAAAQAAREAEEAAQAEAAAKQAAEDQEAADGDFLALAAEGKVDFYDKAVTDRLAALAQKYTDPEGAYLDMIQRAKVAAKNFFIAEFQKKVA
jgi:hypothetical protein